ATRTRPSPQLPFCRRRKKLTMAEATHTEGTMAHDLTYPEALETLLTRLPELQVVLGPQAKGGIESVQLLLQEAVAARAGSDVPRAMRCIGKAMDTLSQLATMLDPQEAMIMRMLAAQFRQALQGGDT